MIVEHITKEQFQTYSQIQEKKEQRDRYEMRNNSLYGRATFSGIAALMSAGGAVLGWDMNMNDFFIGGMGLLAFANGFFCYSRIRESTRNSREMGKLEKEIEELKTQPEYQAVVPPE